MTVSTPQHADIHPRARETFFLFFGRGINDAGKIRKQTSAEHGYRQ